MSYLHSKIVILIDLKITEKDKGYLDLHSKIVILIVKSKILDRDLKKYLHSKIVILIAMNKHPSEVISKIFTF